MVCFDETPTLRDLELLKEEYIAEIETMFYQLAIQYGLE